MVYHLRCVRPSPLCSCSGLVIHSPNVPAYSFSTDIFARGTLQLLRYHVWIHDHAVLRQVTGE